MAAPEGYSALGKIGISYKGEYASSTAYERLDAVAHNGSTYLAIKDAPDGAPRDDKVNWIYLAKGFSGDIGDSEITFTEAETRENIDTGESVKTVFGKIKKWFSDMTVAAFAQVITSNADLMALTKSGYLVDALAVKDQFTEINGKLVVYEGITPATGNTESLVLSEDFPYKPYNYIPIAFITTSFGQRRLECNYSELALYNDDSGKNKLTILDWKKGNNLNYLGKTYFVILRKIY